MSFHVSHKIDEELEVRFLEDENIDIFKSNIDRFKKSVCGNVTSNQTFFLDLLLILIRTAHDQRKLQHTYVVVIPRWLATFNLAAQKTN